MKKHMLSFLNTLFSKRGFIVIRKNSVTHTEFKYRELILQTENFFREMIFPDLSKNKKRINFLTALQGTEIPEAFYLIYFLHKSLAVKGDVCEFGTAQGATSALIANELEKSKKNLWLFDSFQGLSKPTKKDVLLDDILHLKTMSKYAGTMRYTMEEVKNRLENTAFPKEQIRIIPGFIEGAMKKNQLPEVVSFAFIDFDLYEPIAITLDYLHTSLAKGGCIIVDDYNFFSKGAKTAVDEFIKLHARHYKVIFPEKFAGHFVILERIK